MNRMCWTWIGIVASLTVGPLCGAQNLGAQTSEVLYACYVPSTGTVYRIKAPGLSDQCVGPSSGPNVHVEFSWNAEGPPGPKGEKGEKGDPGDTGPQGPPGISGYELVMNGPVVSAFTTTTVTATCPAGKVPTGGGALVEGSDGMLKSSYPTLGGWTVVSVSGATMWTTAYVICVTSS